MPTGATFRSHLAIRLRRPSPALIVAALALVMSVAGNAAGAVIISGNHQVAAHTIAGSNAPGGDNKNLIPGSVGAADLHSGSVSPAALAADSRAHKIHFVHVGSNDDEAWVTLLKLDQLTIHGGCFPYPPNNVVSFEWGFQSSVGGDLNWSYIEDNGSSTSPHAGGTALTANVEVYPTLDADAASSTGPGDRLEGQFIYWNSTRVITVSLHLVADYDLNSLCEATGTAVVATMR